MGHQPKKQIEVTVCGHQLLRPEPSDPTNFWCKVGFHSLADFALPEGVELGLFLKPPRYCTQCFHKEGRVVPPIPKRNAVTKGEELLNKESSILRELDKISRLKDYLDSRRSQLSEELNEIHNSPYYPVNEAKRYPPPPKMPVPPEARVIRENGKPPGNE